ncbi:MAG: flagellar filament outer layer protein FlaA [Spirochaetota bacterium]|nr:MAG: flagellar filament outer layer protein FlaA [Spirochaetota bacterium]
MKLKVIFIIIAGLLLILPAISHAQLIGFMLDYRMKDIQSVVIDDFEDNDNNWQVTASRFTDEEYPQLKFGVEGRPVGMSSTYSEEDNKYVMGVKAAFTRKGYNSVTIYPEEELLVPGRAETLDVWVWGANYYYNLEAHLRDYRGIVHRLPLGSLHFMGWRNLSVNIPKHIPQTVRYLPMEKPLSLVRLVIWTEPTERVDSYVIYFDHMKVLTDMYTQRFDGDELADRTDEIWSSQ